MKTGRSVSSCTCFTLVYFLKLWRGWLKRVEGHRWDIGAFGSILLWLVGTIWYQKRATSLVHCMLCIVCVLHVWGRVVVKINNNFWALALNFSILEDLMAYGFGKPTNVISRQQERSWHNHKRLAQSPRPTISEERTIEEVHNEWCTVSAYSSQIYLNSKEHIAIVIVLFLFGPDLFVFSISSIDILLQMMRVWSLLLAT